MYLIHQPAAAGDGIKPGVKRSGTPGARSKQMSEPAKRATAPAKNLCHNERSFAD